MINIFYVAGMFGSTLEYMLRNFTNNFSPISASVLPDGSMHSFNKEFHYHPEGIEKLLAEFNENIQITTITHPDEKHNLKWIIENWPGDLTKSKNIFIISDNIRDSELNLLFLYYKIAAGSHLRKGLDLFFHINHLDKWNENIKHWSESQEWQLRESYSLFYPNLVTEWAANVAVPNSMIIKNHQLLYDLKETFLKIVNFCELTLLDKELDSFVNEWTSKQQYIVNHFNLLDKVIENTLNDKYFDWSTDRLCIISEAIIQQRLRSLGYEIKCFNLNKFPTNSKDLATLLEKL
jgi:hypothetical protein